MIAGVVLLAGCASSTDTASDDPTTTTRPARNGPLDADICAQLDQEQPDIALVDSVPPDMAAGAEAVVVLGTAADAPLDQESDVEAFAASLRAISTAETSASLTALRDATAESCDNPDVVFALGFFATATSLAAAPADEAYCQILSGYVDPTAAGLDGSLIPELLLRAPAAQKLALDIVVAGTDSVPDDADEAEKLARAEASVGAWTSLGLYAEANCGVRGAFETLLVFATQGATADEIVDAVGSGDAAMGSPTSRAGE